MKYILLYCFLILLLATRVSFSKEINISSDKLIIDRVNNTSTFSGNVYAYEKNMEIWADKLIVKFTHDENEVEEIIAEYNVKVVREDILATGSTGFYYPSLDEVRILENVEIIDDQNIVKCDELVLDLKNSISIMRSNTKSRVEAVLVN